MGKNEVPKILPGERAGAWARENQWVLLFGLLLLLVLPMRGLWEPEAAFARGMGFDQEFSAWALRLPTVLASIAFVYGLRRWAARFFQMDVADLSVLVLCSTPLWFWQSQFIQPDLWFAVLLAWAWLSWLGGYLCLRGFAEGGTQREGARWFLMAYLSLGLAILAKGSLAMVLSGLVLLPFLAWQRDWKALTQMKWGWGLFILAVFWVLPAALQGGLGLGFGPTLHQVIGFTPHDPIQPFGEHLKNLLVGFFPWVLLLPALAFFLEGSGALKSPAPRFMVVAALGPFLFLTWVGPRQGQPLLLSSPFLALLLAGMLQPISVEGVSATRIRRIGGVLGAGLALVALTLMVFAFFNAGGSELRAQIAPLRGPLRLMTVLTCFGALSVGVRAAVGEGQFLVREAALTMGMLFLVGGTWGFNRLNHSYRYSHSRFPGDNGPDAETSPDSQTARRLAGGDRSPARLHGVPPAVHGPLR